MAIFLKNSSKNKFIKGTSSSISTSMCCGTNMRQWRSSFQSSLLVYFFRTQSLARSRGSRHESEAGKQKLEFLDIFVGVSVFSTAGHGFVV